MALLTRPRGLLLPLAAISLLWLAGAWTTASGAARRTARSACPQRTPSRRCGNLLLDKGTSAGHRLPVPAPTVAGACANTADAPAVGNLPAVAAAVLCLINQQRAVAGLRPLRGNARLAGAAQRHSDDMARSGTFDHVGSRGDTFGARIGASGYLRSGRAVTAGENIAWVPARRSTAGAMVADWMSSAEHRANILDPGFRDTGIGLTLAPPSDFTGGGRGTTVTEDFGALH
jgi:uncharacterized protein YkwD